MRNKKSDFITVLFVVLGIVISLQIRTVLNQANKAVPVKDRYVLLKVDLNKEKLNVEYYLSEIEETQNSIKEYEKLAGKNDAGIEQLRLELQNYKLMAGLTDVIGAGTIILLDDSKAYSNNIFNQNEEVIHDLDIIILLNELKIAGAEAISINNERIISTSEQVCAGPTIRINNTRHTIPFTVLAIGNPAKFKQKFEEPEGIIEVLKRRGIMIDIKYSNNIRIPKYKGSIYPLIGIKEGS